MTRSNSLSVIINWVARILGLIVLIFFVWFLIGETVVTIQEEDYQFDVAVLEIIIPIVIALVGYILAWWHKIIGGSLLVLVAIIFAILVAVTAGQQGPMSDFHALMAWLILSLPYLVTGGLFLISAYLDRKAAS
jgi:hypothetical protein